MTNHIYMLCGKGGCGKSTITALLALKFASLGKKVLVIDMDESNYGLHRQLGLDLPKDFTLYFGFKKGIFQAMDSKKEGESLFPSKWSYDSLPAGFVSVNDQKNIKLIAIGKIHDAGEGCACPMGSMAKELLDNLSMEEDVVVLVDTEAGVEHFGRGVDTRAEKILMVVDPSYESIRLTKKISEMCQSIDRPLGIILNKLKKEQESIVKKAVGEDIMIAGVVYYQEEVFLKGLLGEKTDVIPDDILDIINYLEKNI